MKMKTLILSISLFLLALPLRPVEASFFGRHQNLPKSLTSRESSFCGSHHMPCPIAEPCCNSTSHGHPAQKTKKQYLVLSVIHTFVSPSPLSHFIFRWNMSHNIDGGMSDIAGLRSNAFTPRGLFPTPSLSKHQGPVQTIQPLDP